MKFLIAIAMFAFVGFSSTSAAAIDLGNNDMPDSMKAYKHVLESLLRDVSKQITENAAFDENVDLESFNLENIFGDQPIVISTEEEQGETAEPSTFEDNSISEDDEELSTIEDNRVIEVVGDGIRCSWRRMNGQCCQSLRIFRYGINICVGIKISLPAHVRLYLKLNGRTVWSHGVGIRDRVFRVCFRKGPLKMCIHLYNLHLSRHRINVCIRVSAHLFWFNFGRNLGCIHRRFAIDPVPSIMNKPDSFNINDGHNNGLPPKGFVKDNNVLRFEA